MEPSLQGDAHSRAQSNHYLTDSLASLFLKTALPIVFIMLVNGAFTVVDGIFVGTLVSADALSAVTSVFPLFMVVVAISTMVASGMASIMARRLGAGDKAGAEQILAQAYLLSVVVCAVLIATYLLFGGGAITLLSDDNPHILTMAEAYIRIVFLTSPLTFFLSMQGDSLRSEGHVEAMSLMMLAAIVLNGVFNYVLIAHLHLGVAGSAYGTALAQTASIAAVLWYRASGRAKLPALPNGFAQIGKDWKAMLMLGVPSSFGNLGVSFQAATFLLSINFIVADSALSVTAYGIVSRLFAFFFLPLLGLALASQSIIGNNYGAKEFARSNTALKIALNVAFVYCIGAQILFVVFAAELAGMFVKDQAVIDEAAHIIPIMTAALSLTGISFILSSYFQALGDAVKATVVSLSKFFVFGPIMLLVLPHYLGLDGVWWSMAGGEILTALTCLVVLWLNAKRTGARLGMFLPAS
ncbi:MATE family efflux transporter [Polycladidibacter hongkongensis]|uniref:MATE family efflux transporter n=1 Tax=Polycladidibacter hongkongensis TaxID=1647556 RepID=UPI00082D69F7|nr:MATE family efflux transporter [Pseudovibrio hongkongensis]